MPYLVKELFYTLQGEGRNTGRPAVFALGREPVEIAVTVVTQHDHRERVGLRERLGDPALARDIKLVHPPSFWIPSTISRPFAASFRSSPCSSRRSSLPPLGSSPPTGGPTAIRPRVHCPSGCDRADPG